MTTLRALGVAHIVIGVLLLPCAAFFGFMVAPVLALGPLWIAVLGFRLWNANDRVLSALRKTHTASVVMAVLMITYGFLALRAAERSAATGGGLLGGFGILPIGFGILLGSLAGLSLFLARSRGDSLRQKFE